MINKNLIRKEKQFTFPLLERSEITLRLLGKISFKITISAKRDANSDSLELLISTAISIPPESS